MMGEAFQGAARRRALRGRLAMVPLVLAIASACAEPSAVAVPALTVSATFEVGADGLYHLRFSGRNDGREVVQLSGCPSAPAFHLDSYNVKWFEVLSSGVVCPANLVAERRELGPGMAVQGGWTVATPGTYRFRVLVDDPRGGDPRVLTSNPVEVR
jgi:hypothetical protein